MGREAPRKGRSGKPSPDTQLFNLGIAPVTVIATLELQFIELPETKYPVVGKEGSSTCNIYL